MDRSETLQYIDDLFRYAMVLVRNSAEAEDLVQETYVRALPAMGRLRPDSNLKVWLLTILRNLRRNQIRKLRTGPRIVELDEGGNSADVAAEPSEDPYTQYASKAEREHVRKAIEQLPASFREVIILREYDELSYQEIASVLECPLGTVMSRLGRARSKLRGLLSESPAVYGRETEVQGGEG